MAVNIFKPQVSHLVGGLEGKLIMIYGSNRTGKTFNAVQGDKPLVVAFEKGLNAIEGIPFVPINKWSDWTDTVKQLTGPDKDKAREVYQTVIVDTVDSMGDLAAEAICARFNCDTVGSGKQCCSRLSVMAA